VVIYRLPRNESLIRPPSRCPACGMRLGFWDLIPVLSYFLLRGRCRYCEARISPRYPVVEGLTGLLFSLLTWRYFPSPSLLAHLVVASALIAVALIDLEHMLIPDILVLVVAASGIVLDFGEILAGSRRMLPLPLYKFGLPFVLYLPHSVVGGVVGLAVFYVIARVSSWAFRKEAMGEGDVLLAGGLGAYLGPGLEFLLFFIIAALIGAVAGLAFASLRRKSLSTAIPFGPMMAASAIIVALLGERLVASLRALYQI